ncbi:ATP-dependent helicase [Herbiconiux sp. SYSU D00978]|uniref:ATP-dependent helicase n=1 Tax=Herbiconiux sp. SYSU D00978 TaxID=2812562 RepID=UPI001A974B88|nr:ATP-dependent DNA helicase [Herbiconiux sp. SYSU D00978]
MAVLGLKRGADAAVHPVALDDSQRAVLALADDESAVVLGAPGTGKTTTLVELVADRVNERGFSPDEVLVLSPTRAAATRLRDVLALRVGVATSGPFARTPSSLAFQVLRRAAVAEHVEPPKLLTGGEQDAIVRELLAGHVEDGTGPAWPEHLGPDVRALRTFRTELRELAMRATEYGVSLPEMRRLARVHDRPEWAAAADFLAEYTALVDQVRESALDPAELLAFATTEVAEGRYDPPFRLLVLDDAQEATESILGLVRALAARGVTVVAAGDPDVAANSFRGAESDALGRMPALLGIRMTSLRLATVHRHGPELRALISAVTARIGTAAAGLQRSATAVDRPGSVSVIEAPTAGRQYTTIARLLRERHVEQDVPWGRMAVIARSGALLPAIARALSHAEVPTRTTLAGAPLRDDAAVRGLLRVVDVGIGRTPLTDEVAVELLTSPYGGFDRLALRRLRLALRAEELAGGGGRASGALLVEALSAPSRFATIDHRIGRRAARLAETLHALRGMADSGATIEELLWHAWERSGLARSWGDQALSAGVAAEDANRNLDGVVALFTAARRFAERRPGDGPGLFLDDVLSADVPEDTLSPRAAGDAVYLTTPAGAIGLEFDTVVVAGLQEGVWPNLRLRGSLLAPQELVRAASGDTAVVDKRRQVLSDELRMFALAVSRASSKLVLASVANDDEAPSVFLSFAPDAPREPLSEFPLTLRGLTGRLRRIAATAGPASAAEAASGLAQLAAEQVPGADPAEWHGLLPVSTEAPLFDLDDPEVRVSISPSKLEQFEQSPFAWFLDRVAGAPSSTSMSLGTIVHWVMETATDPSDAALEAALESRWSELVFESPWLAERERDAARVLLGAVGEYLRDFERSGARLVAAEGAFELEVGRVRVRGKIDRVEQSADGAVTIVDLKTGSPITKQAEIDEHAQLSAYQLAYAEGLIGGLEGEHRPGGAALLYVKKGKDGRRYRKGEQAPLDEEQLERFRERLRTAARSMAAAGFDCLSEVDVWDFKNSSIRLHTVRAVTE